jgi:hypothetical protein
MLLRNVVLINYPQADNGLFETATDPPPACHLQADGVTGRGEGRHTT